MIYYWHKGTATHYMLFLYRKKEQGDLTKDQVCVLSRIVREEFE